MSDLSSLIERIEAATAGDRELDAEIWLACTPGATRDKWSYIHKATGRECTVDETRDATDRLIIVPSYTTSIDAALTLLPEGWWLTLDRYSISDKNPDPFAWRVWLKRLVGDVDGDGPCGLAQFFATGSTAPLALLAAILRARQAADTEGQ